MPDFSQLHSDLQKKGTSKAKDALGLLSAGCAISGVLSDPSGSLSVATLIKGARSSSDAFSKLKSLFGGGRSGLEDLFDRADALAHEVQVICQYAYFDTLAKQLVLLPEKIKKKKLSSTSFTPLKSIQFNKVAFSLDDLTSELRGGDELFRCFDDRLKVILQFLCSPETDVEDKVYQISSEARRRALRAMSIHPDLSRHQTNELLRSINRKVIAGEEHSTNVTQTARNTESKEILIADEKAGIGLQEADRGRDSENITRILELLEARPSSESGLSQAILDQFESARSFLEEGHLEKAIQRFEVLVGILDASTADKESVNLKGRCECNIGIALHHMHKIEDSFERFDRAYELNSENTRIVTLKAMSCHWREDTGQALTILNELMTKHPDNVSVIVALADVEADMYGPLKAIARLEKLVPDHDAGVSLALAQHLAAADRTDDAIVCLRTALEVETKDAHRLKMALASNLLRSNHNSHCLPVRQSSIEKRKALEEAGNLLESVKEELIKNGFSRDLHAVNFDLGLVYLLSGELEKAVVIFESILDDQINSDEIKQNLILAYLLTGRRPKARELAEQFVGSSPSLLSYRSLQGSLNANRNFRRSLEVFDKLIVEHPEHAHDPILRIQYFEALIGLHRKTEAEKQAELLEKEFPAEPRVLASLGDYYISRKQMQKGEELFEKAISEAQEGLSTLFSNQLGVILWKDNQVDKALPFLRVGFPDDIDNPHSFEIASCLYDQGKYSDAYTLISSRDLEICEVRELDLRSAIEIKTSDYRRALNTLELLIEKSHAPEYCFRLVYVCQILGEDDRASDILSDIYERYSKELRVILRLSSTHYERKEYRKGFDYAKEAYKLDPDCQDAIVSICTAMIAPEGELVLNESEVDLVRQCIDKNKGMKKIVCVETADGEMDINPILDMVRLRAEHAQDFLSTYHSGRCPLFNLLQLSGGNVWQCYQSAIHSPDVSIFSSTGTLEEQQAQFAVALKANSVVLDFTSILVIFELGLEEGVISNFESILVPGTLLPAFKQALSEERAFGHDGSVMSFKDGQYQMFEYPADVKGMSLQTLEKIVDFLQSSHVEICGVEPEKLKGLSDDEDVSNLPDLILSPFTLAKARSVPCWTDQSKLAIAMNLKTDVDSFSTQYLLMALWEKGMMTSDQTEDATIRLIQMGYRSIPHRSSTIMRCIDNGDSSYQQSAVQLIGRINNKEWELSSTARILAAAIADIWVYGTMSHESKAKWIKTVATELDTQLFKAEVFFPFLNGLYIKLKSIPAAFFGLLDQLGSCFISNVKFKRRLFRNVKISIAEIMERYPEREGEAIAREWKRQAYLELILLGKELSDSVSPQETNSRRSKMKSRKKNRMRRRK